MNAVQAEVHTLTGAYVCDALDEQERADFERHLQECAECRAEVAELREVAASLAVSVAEPPPPGLKAAVEARIRVTRQLPPIVTSLAEARARRRPTRLAWAGWAAAAALALVVAGLGWRAIDQQHQINTLSAQSTQLSQLLSAPDAYSVRVSVTGGGSALLVDSRSRNEAAVAFTGLAYLPSNKTYQLWLMQADGTARSVGLMHSDPNSPVFVHGLAGEAEVGMTIEPAGGSPKPTTTPVMVAALGA
jgi:anti-sigma-K factor RskA